MKKQFVSILLIVSIVAVSGCGNKTDESYTKQSEQVEDITTINFDLDFQKLANMDAEGLSSYLKNNGEDNFQRVTIEPDDTVSLELTDRQLEYWKKYTRKCLDKEVQELTDINEKYNATFSDDYKEINAFYDMDLSFEDAFGFVGDASIYCAMYQMFNGIADYDLSLNVFNADTKKIVVGGNLETDDVSYDNTEWGKSYTLSDDEISTIKENADVDDISALSTFVDGISVLDIFVTATSDDYTYLCLDKNGSLHIGLNNEQKENIKNELVGYLKQIESQFENIGDNYKINVDKDYSNISYKFDSQLSKQEQSNYFIYSETICMLLQVINNTSPDFYIEINIYDSSTGELVSTGDTKNGITWNIGDE